MLRRSNGSPRPRNYESLLTDDDNVPLSIRPKMTCSKKTPIDRISMLPDSLLTHILSFLPIEDAIKTDVLSKRWQYLWTTLPSLLFRLPYPDSVDTIREFVTFVDKTLVLCNSSKIKKFVVDFKYDSRFSSNVNLWTRFATRNAAEELHLEFHTADNYLHEDVRFVLPQLLFTNSSFTELRFSLCTVMPKGVVCWKLLKKLSIGYVKLNDGVMGKILAGSPVLENLELYYFYGITRLHVVNAHLDDDFEWHQNISRRLLQSLVHVKNLTLGTWLLQKDTDIKESYFSDVRPRLFNFNGEHYWTSQKKTFNCLMMHLKIVKCAGLRWCYRGCLFSFVQFLLKNARVLQQMVINVDCLPHKELFQVAQKFLSFPRSSPNAVIMFN
ncbi:unnamed protein product [Camellia sinensis]